MHFPDLTPLFRVAARRRVAYLDGLDVDRAQSTTLLRLVRKARSTAFGKDHRFGSVRSVDDYIARTPLRTYEQFWSEYWKAPFPFLRGVTWDAEIPYFALSSGTTSGTTKYLPRTREALRCDTRAGVDLLAFHLHSRPASRLCGGKSFFLGGSTDLTTLAPGIRAGDLSGITSVEMPFWARARSFPPPGLALLKDWEEKVGKLSRLSLTEDVRLLAGVPSWLLVFIDALGKAAGKPGAPLRELYPDLEMLVHGGVAFPPYQKRFDALLDGSKAETREVYPSSEAFVAVADRGPGEGMRLAVDAGTFFEFVPVSELGSPSPTRHWGGRVETGVDYAVTVTTPAGLWSYLLGDTVRFVGRAPPRLVVTGRTSYSLSAFGEHLIAEEVDGALRAAAETCGVTFGEYAMGVRYPDHERPVGGHRLIIETLSHISADTASRFAAAVDRALSTFNEDYRAHREGGVGLDAPELIFVREGAFFEWMRGRGKLGGQHKVPRLVADPGLFQEILDGTGALRHPPE